MAATKLFHFSSMYCCVDESDTKKTFSSHNELKRGKFFDFDETWCTYFHQVSSKSDEKQKSFINSPFFCSEFQSVSRIVKIVHSAKGADVYV